MYENAKFRLGFSLGFLLFLIAFLFVVIQSSEETDAEGVKSYYFDALGDVVNVTGGIPAEPGIESNEMDIAVITINETSKGINVTITCNTTVPSTVGLGVLLDRDCDNSNDLMFAGSITGAVLYEFYLNCSYFKAVYHNDCNVSFFIPIENISNIRKLYISAITMRNVNGNQWMDFADLIEYELRYPRMLNLGIYLVQRGDLDAEHDYDDIVVRVGNEAEPFMQGYFVTLNYYNDPSQPWHAGGMISNITTTLAPTVFYDLPAIYPNVYKVVAYTKTGEYIGSVPVFVPLDMTVEGIVVDDGFEPIEGVKVEFSNSYIDRHYGGTQIIYTNSTGRFSISLVNNTYSVKFSKIGYTGTSLYVSGNDTLYIVLKKRPWMLMGFVKDEFGTPVENGTIYLSVRGGLENIYGGELYEIGAGGFYRIPIDNESYFGIDVVIISEGYYPKGKEITFSEMGNVTWSNVTLKHLPLGNWVVKGYIKTNDTHEGVQAYVAFVDLAHSYSTFVISNSLGYYEIELYPGSFIMMIFSFGYYRTTTSLNILPSDEIVWYNITVHRVVTDVSLMRTIEGCVLDDCGLPVSGASVTAWNEEHSYFAESNSMQSYINKTGDDGKFNISVPEGRYLLIVTYPMLASNISYVIDLSGGNVSGLVVVMHALPRSNFSIDVKMITWSYGETEKTEYAYMLGNIDSNYLRWLFDMSYGNNDHYVNETESAFFSSIMEENFGSEIIDESADKIIGNVDGIQMKIEDSTVKFEMDFTGYISSCLPIKFKIRANFTSDGFVPPNKSFYNLTLYIENTAGAEINITFVPPEGYLLNSYSCMYYEHSGVCPVVISGSGVYVDVDVRMRFADSISPTIIVQTNVELDEDVLYYFDASQSTENTADGIVIYNWTVYNSTQILFYSESSNVSYLAYRFSSPGAFKVDLVIYDLAGNSNSSTINVYVRDKELPIVVIDTLSLYVNEDEYVVFNSLSTDNYQIVSQNWNFGDGMQSVGSSVSHIFSNPGNYTVTLTVYDGVNYNSTTITITVLDITPPSVSISAPLLVDEDTVVIFDGLGTSDNDVSFGINGIFVWTIYDYNSIEVRLGRQVTYLFEQPGTYLIVLNVSDNAGNWNESSAYITVRDKTKPKANISLTSFIFDEDVPILFSALNSSDNVGILSYEWNFGDNTGIFLGGEQYHVYTTPGKYLVSLTVRDAFWNDTLQMEIIVRDVTPPVCIYNVELNVFEDELINFDAYCSYDNSLDFSTTGSATWNFFDNGTMMEVSITAWYFAYIFIQPGAYQIELNVSDGSNNFNKTIFVLNVKDKTPPIANITIDNFVFDEDTPILFSSWNSSDNVGISTYTWSFGDDTGTYSGEYVLHEYSKPGVYQVTLIVKDEAGLENRASVLVKVRDVTPPIASIDVYSSAYEDLPVVISSLGSSDNVGIVSYDWDFGDDNYANGSQVIHVYEMPGVYLINLTVIDKEGNSNYTTRTITIYDVTSPSCDFYLPAEWDEDEFIIISARNSTDNVGIVNCTWDLDASNGIDNRDGFGLEFNTTFARPGNYLVTLHVFDAAGNENYTQRKISIIDKTPPTAYAGSAQSATTGKRVYFNASGSTDNVGIVSYEWDFGDGKSASGADVSHVYTKMGKYKVTLTVRDAQGLEGKTIVEVEVVNPAQDMRLYYVLATLLAIGALFGGIIGVRAYRKWKLGGFEVEDVFLIYQDGRMIGHKSARKEELDSDVVAGMLVAVESFINDTFATQYGKSSKVGKLEWSGKKILVKKGEKFTLAVVIEGYDWESLHKKIENTAEEIRRKFGDKLDSWDGDTAEFQDAEKVLGEILIKEGVVKKSEKNKDEK